LGEQLIKFEEYDLYQPSLLSRIQTDERAFRKCIAGNYLTIAREFGSDIALSQSRLADTHTYWLADLGRLLSTGMQPETKILDHFKQAAFLTFWLRRHIPATHVFSNPMEVNGLPATDRQRFFALYGNELCALHIGLDICHSYELQKLTASLEDAAIGDKVAVLLKIANLKSRMIISPDFEVDFVVNLKHKNNSPHSIYLIFRAIFGA
jgi:hypothetical protein